MRIDRVFVCGSFKYFFSFQAICSLQLEVEDLRCLVRKTESERDYFESALNRMQA